MRRPISAKTLFRLHRKLFMIRTPRMLSGHSYSLSFSHDGKMPIVGLHIERDRTPVLGITLAAVMLLLTALMAPREK